MPVSARTDQTGRPGLCSTFCRARQRCWPSAPSSRSGSCSWHCRWGCSSGGWVSVWRWRDQRRFVLFDVAGPRTRVRNHLISAIAVVLTLLVIWVVYSRLESKGKLTAAKWEPFVTANLWKTYILPGVQGTLTAAAVSIVLALVLGFVLGVGRLSSHTGIRWACSVSAEFFRAVPVLIMMIFAFFLYAFYDVFPSKHLALAGVITGLTLYNSAVIAEIVARASTRCPAVSRRPHRPLACVGARPCGRFCCRRPSPPCCRVDLATGSRAEGHRDRLSDHVLGDGAPGHAGRFGVWQLHPGTWGHRAVDERDFALSSFGVRVEGRMRRSRRGPAPMHADQPVTQGSFGAGAGGSIEPGGHPMRNDR